MSDHRTGARTEAQEQPDQSDETEGGGHDVRHGPRGLTITLSTPFVESLTLAQLTHYVHTVADLGENSADYGEDELVETLRRRLDEADVRLPDQSYITTARTISTAHGPLSIITDRDEVLYGDTTSLATQNDPDVVGTEDPEDPDRPTYS